MKSATTLFACLLSAATCLPPSPAQAAPDDVACTAPIALERQLQADGIVMMGEIHGTVESPAAFGAVVCRALALGREVSVGLELPDDQVEPLARYLASDGGAAAREAMLRTRFWSRTMQDGRSGVAMLALIERLRQWRRGSALAVFALEDDAGIRDASANTPPGAQRDHRMALRVRAERARRPRALILTLTGNVHNRLVPLSMGGAMLPTPMGVFLADLAPRSVDLDVDGGSGWMCTPACGIHALMARPAVADEAASKYRDLPAGGPYTSRWALGAATASPPAVAPGTQ